jgi:TfoX/Sxy family transcriptional regulator of competence genes
LKPGSLQHFKFYFMATKKVSEVYANKLAIYEKLVATNPSIERKGDTMPYTSLNGNMFSLLGKDGSLGFRLSKEDREEFLEKFNSGLMEQYGAVMKEYVVIPDQILNSQKELKKYFDLSYAYAKTLKPKATSKTKAAKKKKK